MINCEKCRFWDRDGKPDSVGNRGCLRYPPVPMMIRGVIQVVQPKTVAKRYCGEGKAIPTHEPITEEDAKAIDDESRRYIDIVQSRQVFQHSVLDRATDIDLDEDEEHLLFGFFMRGGVVGATKKLNEIRANHKDLFGG